MQTMMNPIWPGRLALAVLVFLCGADLARAQDRYKHWDIDPKYQDLLNERFKADQQLGPLKDLVKQLMANPEKLPFNPDQLKDMKLDDENLKKLVADWVANDKDVQKSLRGWLSRIPSATSSPT